MPCLRYADDMVLLAKVSEHLRGSWKTITEIRGETETTFEPRKNNIQSAFVAIRKFKFLALHWEGTGSIYVRVHRSLTTGRENYHHFLQMSISMNSIGNS